MNTLYEILKRKEELETKVKVYEHFLNYSPRLAAISNIALNKIYQELADLTELEEQKEKEIIEISNTIITSFYK